MGTTRFSECDLAIPFAVKAGFPDSYFIHFENSARNTRDEATQAAAAIRKMGAHRVLLVTSDFQHPTCREHVSPGRARSGNPHYRRARRLFLGAGLVAQSRRAEDGLSMSGSKRLRLGYNLQFMKHALIALLISSSLWAQTSTAPKATTTTKAPAAAKAPHCRQGSGDESEGHHHGKGENTSTPPAPAKPDLLRPNTVVGKPPGFS